VQVPRGKLRQLISVVSLLSMRACLVHETKTADACEKHVRARPKPRLHLPSVVQRKYVVENDTLQSPRPGIVLKTQGESKRAVVYSTGTGISSHTGLT
jgi:hypothetical protein